MTDFLVPPPQTPTLCIADSGQRFPIRRIFCVGRNYAAHAAEMGGTVDREAPWYFTKSAHHAVSAPASAPIPPGTSNYHHEIEWCVALGSGGTGISATEAMAHVIGHTVGLDMTRRDVQAQAKDQRRPWDTAKDVEDSAIFGPLLTNGLPAPDAQLSLTLNGETRQSAPLSDMIWSVPEIIAHLSGLYRLDAGDVIMTGTPAGVGPVVAGDRVVAQLDATTLLDLTFR